MSENIKVTVIRFGQKFLRMKYVDPLTGKAVVRSTGTTDRKKAERLAAVWEDELRNGKYKPASKITWEDFRQRYESERVPALAHRTAEKISDVFNSVTALIGVDKLSKLDSQQISRYQRLLRDQKKLAESTIKSHLSHLLAALNWAKKVGLLAEVPKFEMPKRTKGGKMMKGRPVTLEEFERILAKIPEVVCGIKADPESTEPPREPTERETEIIGNWKWFLRGLWFSGLRLGEALNLSWDESGCITVDFAERYAMFCIPGDRQKSGQDQLLPVSPEFAEQLLSVPQDQRTGNVFKLGKRNVEWNPGLLAVSKMISAIGKAAGVVVNKSPIKYASAHDFRRSFGERWSSRVMPATLQAMMRHSDITTTMKYYVGQNAQRAASEIYAAFAAKNEATNNTASNTSPETPESTVTDSTQSESAKEV